MLSSVILPHPLHQPHYRHSKYATQNTGYVVISYPSTHPFHTPFTSPTTDTLTVCHQKDWLSSIITCIPRSHPFHRLHTYITKNTRSGLSLVTSPFTPPLPAPLPTFTVCHQKDWLSSSITCIPRSHPRHPHYRHSHSM